MFYSLLSRSFVLLAVVARAVVAKARPEDLQHILPGLGQVLASLALFPP
ncbi:hypothetical protein ACIHCQ_41215 [Streptomyces sp. NPDC052236]